MVREITNSLINPTTICLDIKLKKVMFNVVISLWCCKQLFTGADLPVSDSTESLSQYLLQQSESTPGRATV